MVKQKPTSEYEKSAWENNKLLMGVDEVGTGSAASNIVLGFVIFPKHYNFETGPLSQVNDSKQLTENKRFELATLIKQKCLWWAVDLILVEEVESANILTLMFEKIKQRAETDERLKNLNYRILYDGNKKIPNLNVENDCLIKGDAKCFSIASASILAKTTRDSLMIELSKQHPEYGWEQNKGYASKQHIEAIKKYGLTEHHRKRYCRNYI